MSCEESRGRFLATVSSVDSGELERLFVRERGIPANKIEAASNEAKTRLLFAQFARCEPPLRPPTHSANGLPRRDAQRGYARLYDHLADMAIAGRLQRCPNCGQFGQTADHNSCPVGASGLPDAEPVGNAAISSTAPVSTRQYTYRNDDVAAEVGSLPAVEDADFTHQALAAKQPETAAHAIRQLLRAGQQPQARQVGEHLAKLIAPRLAAISRSHFPYHPHLREELVQELSMRIWQDLVDLRPSQDFITFNCRCVLNRDGASIAYRLRQPGRHERQFERGEGEDAWSEEDTLAAGTPDPETTTLAEDLLKTLQPRERLVAYLLAQGVPISSPDPEQVTIARLLGVTERSVRNYRRSAARQILAAGIAPAS